MSGADALFFDSYARRTRARFASFACLPFFLLCAGTSDAAAQTTDRRAVASVGAQTITAAQLEERASSELVSVRTHEYQRKREILDDLILDMLVKQEAGRRGLTVEEIWRTEVDAKTHPPRDLEVDTTYKMAAQQFAAMPEADAKAAIRANYLQRARAIRKREYYKELRAVSPVSIDLPPPRVHVDEKNRPARGPAEAAVVIIEFSDFECPFCARATQTLAELEKRYPAKIRRVFKNFPLPNHAQAIHSAEAALCASEQGSFWDVHDRLFASQRSLGAATSDRIAGELKLNLSEFQRCLESGRMSALWNADKAEGERFGMTGTPFFFINGRFLSGAQPIDVFVEIIEDELKMARPPAKTQD
jgi:protein-disulfide isomerase